MKKLSWAFGGRRGAAVLFVARAAVVALLSPAGLMSDRLLADDVTFNISKIAEVNPHPAIPPSNFSYGDVWAEGGFVYVGSDRSGRGIDIFSISNSGIPVYLTTYAGSEMEDVEVYDGIGYFGSDVFVSAPNPKVGTGVDIVDLAIPFDPLFMSRVNQDTCSAAGCGHYKVHTLSVSNDVLYTADNETDIVKIVDVADPYNPLVVKSLDIGAPSGVASHEVVARNDRLYVASKNNSSTSCCGWTHIYDVANPASPVLLKAFLSGPRTHTALPSEDGNLLVVTEERPNGSVHLYDISMIDSPNDPDSPVLLSTLTRSNVGIDAHSPHHPHLHGNLLFLAWYEAGLQVFNISDPTSPVQVGAFDTWPGTSSNYNGLWGIDVSIGLNQVLLSDRKRGLIVVDVTDIVMAGDYNQDNVVDAADIVAWSSTFGEKDSGQHIAPLADGNYNGVVDAADYVIWRKAMSAGGAGGAVPEPGALVLVAMIMAWGSCGGGARRERRG